MFDVSTQTPMNRLKYKRTSFIIPAPSPPRLRQQQSHAGY